jgi:two-component system chemotaxis sensor kinase CheA
MKQLLIAEDDFFIRDIYSRVFTHAGYEVHAAVDGADALEKLKLQMFDIMLLDIMMPKLNGIEVLRTIRTTLESPKKELPIFIITNLGQQNVIDEALKMGVSGYIIKSQLTPDEVVAKVNAFFQERT